MTCPPPSQKSRKLPCSHSDKAQNTTNRARPPGPTRPGAQNLPSYTSTAFIRCSQEIFEHVPRILLQIIICILLILVVVVVVVAVVVVAAVVVAVAAAVVDVDDSVVAVGDVVHVETAETGIP